LKLDFALLAEAAAGAEGKLYLHGAGLRRIDVPQLPWASTLAVVARFTADLEEAGAEHEIQLTVYSPDREEILLPPPIPLVLPTKESLPGDWVEMSAVALAQLTGAFAVEGWFEFELKLDGEHLTTMRLRIVDAKVPIITSGPVEQTETDQPSS
jgi:hypothetical protein